MALSEPTPWHRLFGLSWIDFFDGTNVEVRAEVDLSLKQQFLDLILIRKGAEPVGLTMPDGMENLTAHNLVTFKSHQEALDDWALMELVGHYVNYRKQTSPSMRELLPAQDFGLFAVCARFPQNLEDQQLLTKLENGVYEIRVLSLSIRVIVANQLPEEEQNAMLHLFSAHQRLISYGQKYYRPRSTEISSLLLMLFAACFEETDMTDEVKEIFRDTLDQLLKRLPREMLRKQLSAQERLEGLPPEERLKGLPPEERLKGLPPEERLKGLPPEERLKGLPPEERLKGLPPEERLKGLPPEERLKGLTTEELLRGLTPEALESLARRLKVNGSTSE